jgi:hypothetical protein
VALTGALLSVPSPCCEQAAAVAASVWFRDLPHAASTNAAVRDAVTRKLRAAAEVSGGAGAVVSVRSTRAAPGGGTQVEATVTLPPAGQAVSPQSVAAALAVRLDSEASVLFAADAALGTLGDTPGRVQDRWVWSGDAAALPANGVPTAVDDHAAAAVSAALQLQGIDCQAAGSAAAEEGVALVAQHVQEQVARYTLRAGEPSQAVTVHVSSGNLPSTRVLTLAAAARPDNVDAVVRLSRPTFTRALTLDVTQHLRRGVTSPASKLRGWWHADGRVGWSVCVAAAATPRRPLRRRWRRGCARIRRLWCRARSCLGTCRRCGCTATTLAPPPLRRQRR